jgi:hypothetical protein
MRNVPHKVEICRTAAAEDSSLIRRVEPQVRSPPAAGEPQQHAIVSGSIGAGCPSFGGQRTVGSARKKAVRLCFFKHCRVVEAKREHNEQATRAPFGHAALV